MALLLAITMAIGAFVAGWFQRFTESNTQEVAEKTKTKCNFVTLNELSPSYTAATYTLAFDVENTGTASVKVNKIQVIYDDNAAVDANFTAATIDAGGILSFSQNYTTTGALIKRTLRTVRVVTECPEVSFNIRGDDVSGAT